MPRRRYGWAALVAGSLAIVVAVLLVFGLVQRLFYPDPRDPLAPWFDIGRGVVAGALVAVYAFWVLRAREREIVAAERRTFAFLQHLPIGVVVVDRHGRLVYVNDEGQEILGRAPRRDLVVDDLPGHYDIRIAGTDRPYPPEHLPLRRAFSEGIVRVDDLEVRRPDGTTVRLEVVAEPMIEDGEVVHCLATFEDITEEKKAQAALLRVHNLLRTVVESTTDAVFVKDRAGRYLLINEAGAEAIGRPIKEILGQTDGGLLGAETAEEVTRTDEAVFTSGHPQHREEHIKTPDGERVFLASKAPVTDPHGRVVGLVGISRDITRRKATQRKAARLAAIVEASEDAIIGLDTEGRITDWNRGAKRLFGWRAEEVRGEHVSLLFPDDDGGSGMRILRLALQGRSIEHHQTRRRTRSGREIDVSVALAPIQEDGRVVGLSSIIRDISAWKHAEEERIKRVSQEQELQRLKRFSALKTQFINTAAHELYTPLTPLQLQFELLKRMRETDADEREMRALERIGRNIDRLKRLVREVVDVSRLETEWVALQQEAFDLGDAVRSAVVDLRDKAKERDVIVDVDTIGPLRAVGDPARVEQAVAHLVDNAIKFSHEGGHVSVRAYRRDGQVVVSVQDEGEGVETEVVDSLFLPFEQDDRHRDMAGSGWGLGLYVVKTIVERHGGTVWVESDGPGEGATFSFSIPEHGAGATGIDEEEVAAGVPGEPVEGPEEMRAATTEDPLRDPERKMAGS